MANKLIFGTGASAAKKNEELEPLIETALQCGIDTFDTAPSYGTESMLGKSLIEASSKTGFSRSDYHIQTKIDVWQMNEGHGTVRNYVDEAIKQMQCEYIDTLLIHWPYPDYTLQTWNNMRELKSEGIVKAIGICNVNMRVMKTLTKSGVVPEIIQIERNPLRTCTDEINFCRDNHITVQAYSPLCKMDTRLKESQILQNFAGKYGKSIGQIIMRWHIDTGVNPVFTTKKISRIKEYQAIDDFTLEPEDINEIYKLNCSYKMYLESMLCPGY